MKKINLISFAIMMLVSSLSAQEGKKISFSLSGYVKTDIIYDSRQTVSVREGHLLLFPENKLFDENNKDINAQPNFNILSIQSRVKGTITGPDALGASTSGVMEAEFFGHTNADINGFRLRLAFVKLQWENTSLLAGQYWHPMFVTEVFANVVSFNTGIPFQPFSRNPQVRLKHNFGLLSLAATAYTQRDFSSPGPSGTSSSYLRNAVTPGLHLQTMFEFPDLLFGFGADYKTLRPRLVTEENIATDETISSFAGIIFGKYHQNDFSIKVQGTYGGNLNDLLMIGGYAVYEKDPITGIEKYTPLNMLSFWTDIAYGKKTEVGLFAGFASNKGSDKEISASYSRGLNIEYLYRISPRVIFNIDQFRIAGEVEYTVAAYGISDAKGKVSNSQEVGNLRILTAVYLFF